MFGYLIYRLSRLVDIILYLFFLVLFPNRKDFLKMGLGIKSRYHCNFNDWELHHKKIRKIFLEQFLSEENKNQSICIIGAGRLYDLRPVDLKLYKEILLIDADPLALLVSKIKFLFRFKNIKTICLDITGLIDATDFNNIDLSFSNVEKIFYILNNKFNHVVSLNLLGQIPLYFYDKLENQNISGDNVHKLIYKIQSEHLELIKKLSLDKSMIVTDLEFIDSEGITQALSEQIREKLTIGYLKLNDWIWELEKDIQHKIAVFFKTH
jgi:hypothetical protein